MSDATVGQGMDLLSCPFCGGKVEMSVWELPSVSCSTCDIVMERFDEGNLVAAWNRRAPAAAQEAQLWSDERVGEEITENAYTIDYNGDRLVTDANDAIRTCRQVRDDYEAQRAAQGASVPSDIAETIDRILRDNRKRALDLTNWDYDHERRVDAALTWLAQQRGQG